MIEQEYKELKDFILNNKKTIIIGLVFLLITFGYATTLFTLGVSTETSVFNEASGSYRWVAQSRFSVGILKKIFSTNQILPFRTTFLAVIMIFIVAMYACKTFDLLAKGKNKVLSNIILIVLFITMPISVHYMYYLTYSFEIGMGMLICIMASDCFNKGIIIKKSKVYSFIGLLLLSVGIGVYQSFVPFFILVQSTCLFLYFYNNNIKFKEKMSIIVKCIVFLLVAMVLFYLISKIFLIFVTEEKYTDGFFSWGKKEVKEILIELKEYFKNIYINTTIYGCKIITPTVLIGVLLAIYCALFKKKWFEGLIIMFIMFTPMLLPISVGTAMPYRTQQTIMLMIPIIWYLLSNIVGLKKINNIICIIVCIIGIRQTMYVNKLFYSDYLRYQNDLNLSRKISNRIYDLNLDDIQNYPVVYLGKKETEDIPNLIRQELIGYSIYEWDNGNYKRMQHFMTLTTSNFKLATSEDYEKAKELGKNMENWPSKNSVALKDNLIIVKLSDY